MPRRRKGPPPRLPKSAPRQISQGELEKMLIQHAAFLKKSRERYVSRGRITLNKVSMRGLNFKGANLSHASFQVCEFHDANLEDCRLDSVSMQGCLLPNASLKNSSWYSSYAGSCKFHHAEFSKAQIVYSNMKHSYFNEARFEDSVIDNVDLDYTDLSGTLFKKCMVARTELGDAYMEGTKIEGGDWKSLDFRNASLEKMAPFEEVRGIGVVPGTAEVGEPVLLYSGFNHTVAVWRGRHLSLPVLERALKKEGKPEIFGFVRFYVSLTDWA